MGTACFFDENTGFTAQYIYPDAEISLNIGDKISGMEWRFDTNAPSIAGNVSWPEFNIVLGEGTGTVASPSLTFASNISNPLSVRSGSLVQDFGSFDNSVPTPNDFGPEIVFDNQYTYMGGDLVVEWRWNEPTIDDPTVTFGQFVDAVGALGPTSSETNGNTILTTFGTPNAHLATMGTQTFQTLPVFNLSVTSVPEPSSFACLGVIGLVAVGFRWFNRHRNA